ncbi:MAG: DNA-3-methyladenine glycosylase [Candidatus Bathyarchaeia archaeon]|jgi:DNA-3-methyladenine glycosylase II
MTFPNISKPQTFQLGARHISRVDPKIRELVKKHGPIKFTVDGDPFESLVEAIISQQLSGQSARAIFGKLKALLQTEVIDAQALNNLTASKLRKAGVSPQKIRYLKDLSSRVVNGQLDLNPLRRKSDDEVIRILDEVKGIGPWTAQMFLLFVLGRPDVLPADDLGIQLAIQKVYSLRKLPKAEKIEEIATNWHPYCSIASLYLWHAKKNRFD